MKIYYFFFIFIIKFCLKTNGEIVNWSEVSPFIVGIHPKFKNDLFIGTVLAPYWIICEASHLIKRRITQSKSLIAIIGARNINTYELYNNCSQYETREVNRIVLSPKYDSKFKTYNLALLKTRDEIIQYPILKHMDVILRQYKNMIGSQITWIPFGQQKHPEWILESFPTKIFYEVDCNESKVPISHQICSEQNFLSKYGNVLIFDGDIISTSNWRPEDGGEHRMFWISLDEFYIFFEYNFEEDLIKLPKLELSTMNKLLIFLSCVIVNGSFILYHYLVCKARRKQKLK